MRRGASRRSTSSFTGAWDWAVAVAAEKTGMDTNKPQTTAILFMNAPKNYGPAYHRRRPLQGGLDIGLVNLGHGLCPTSHRSFLVISRKNFLLPSVARGAGLLPPMGGGILTRPGKRLWSISGMG